jgi:predicted TIM-barrel fold metal-dependent hydrolase
MDDPLAVRERHTIGVDNLMFFTDYPHSETTWPDSRKVVDEQLHGIPEDEKHKLRAGNAVRLYHLG